LLVDFIDDLLNKTVSIPKEGFVMNKKFIYLLLLVMLVVLAFPGTAMAKGLQDDRVVAGGTFTLESGETLDGSLIVFGGTASVEEESIVEGDIVVLGGIVTIDGSVDGNVVGVGGVVNLKENATVDGDLTAVAATLNREPGAQVSGQVITGIDVPAFSLLPGTIDIPALPEFQPSFVNPFAFTLWRVFWFIFRTLLWGALAALVAMFLPDPTTRTSQAIAKQPVLAGGVGLLTIVIAPIVLILLAITCILSPISLLGVMALVVAWVFGRIAIGLEIGVRIAKMFEKDWPLPVAAGIGTFSLALVVDSVGTFIYCVGWLVPALIGLFGIGGVILTRFGTQQYPPESELGMMEDVSPVPQPLETPDAPSLEEEIPDPNTQGEVQDESGKE
jgi:cytoskeletal protein CcmA (bactofilin family)